MLTIKNGAGRNAVFLLALAVLLAGCLPPGPRAVLAGKRLIGEGRYTEAIDQLKVATSLLATNAVAWEYLGLAYHHAGQVANAVKAYRKALALDQRVAEVHYNLGCLGLEINRKDWLNYAKREFTTYTLMRSNSVVGWIRLGTVQLRLNELGDAERSYERALRLDPQNPEALNDLGLANARQGHPRKAQEYFNSALAQQPDYGPALLNLAVVSQVDLQDVPSALREYQAYLALPSSGPHRAAVRGLVNKLKHNRHATTSPPTAQAGSAVVKTNASHSVRHQQPAPSRPPARNHQLAVKPSRTTNSSVRTRSFRARSHAARPTHSRHSRPAVATTRSSNSAAAATAGIARYHYHHPRKPRRGNVAAARRAFAQGVQAQQAHRWLEAVQSYLQATRLDPADYNAYYNLGLAATSAGNLDLALSSYETALAIRPDSQDARYNFALVLARRKYPLDAANEFKKVLAGHPNDAHAHLALANLYAEQLHEPAQAREQYLKVLQNDPHIAQASAIRAWLRAHSR